jgi:hypothetical protein
VRIPRVEIFRAPDNSVFAYVAAVNAVSAPTKWNGTLIGNLRADVHGSIYMLRCDDSPTKGRESRRIEIRGDDLQMCMKYEA